MKGSLSAVKEKLGSLYPLRRGKGQMLLDLMLYSSLEIKYSMLFSFPSTFPDTIMFPPHNNLIRQTL